MEMLLNYHGDDTILLVTMKQLTFVVTRIGLKNVKQMPMHPIPISPSGNNNNKQLYYDRIIELFYLTYKMKLKNLKHIGVISTNIGNNIVKKSYVLSSEIYGSNKFPQGSLPCDVTSFEFLEIQHIVQKLLTNKVSDIVYGTCCLYKKFMLKNNSIVSKMKLNEIDDVKEATGGTNHDNHISIMNNNGIYCGPIIDITKLKLLKSYNSTIMEEEKNNIILSSSNDIIIDNKNNYNTTTSDNDNNNKSNNVKNNTKKNNRENVSDEDNNSSIIIMNDIDINNNNKGKSKQTKNRRPTLFDLGFGEQLPRKNKVDHWLHRD